MNFTERYIKMCDTPEIQDNWKPEVGDWYVYDDNLADSLIIHGIDPINKQTQCQKIWLPLQHQLQEMVVASEKFKSNLGGDLLLFAYCNRIANFCWHWYSEVTDMNELTLLFAMRELYQKKWNNTKEVWE